MEEAKAANEKAALARAYSVLDVAYQWMGQPEKAVYSKDALALYEELGDVTGQATVISNQGVAAYFDGRWDEAAALYIKSRDLYKSAGNEVAAADRDANLGELRINQGYLDQADEVLQSAIRVLKASGFIDGAAFCEVQIARVLMERGRSGRRRGLAAKGSRHIYRAGRNPERAGCRRASSPMFAETGSIGRGSGAAGPDVAHYRVGADCRGGRDSAYEGGEP